MPEIEGWVPEEPYPATVVPEQFWTLHLGEAWKVAGDRRSPFTWDGISESVAGICGVRKVARYVEPPCWCVGEPDFYVKREQAPYVRHALLGAFTERIVQALYKLDKDRPDEARAVIEDLVGIATRISNDFRVPGVEITWRVGLGTVEAGRRPELGVQTLGLACLGEVPERKYEVEVRVTEA